jgi:hypothetical protein
MVSLPDKRQGQSCARGASGYDLSRLAGILLRLVMDVGDRIGSHLTRTSSPRIGTATCCWSVATDLRSRTRHIPGRGAEPRFRFQGGDRRRLRRRPTRGLPSAGRPGIMGRMPQTDPDARHLRCPSDCRITAHVEAGRRPRPWAENLVGVLPAAYCTPLADQPLPALLFTALAPLAGRLLALLGSVAVSLFGLLLGGITMGPCRGDRGLCW